MGGMMTKIFIIAFLVESIVLHEIAHGLFKHCAGDVQPDSHPAARRQPSFQIHAAPGAARQL